MDKGKLGSILESFILKVRQDFNVLDTGGAKFFGMSWGSQVKYMEYCTDDYILRYKVGTNGCEIPMIVDHIKIYHRRKHLPKKRILYTRKAESLPCSWSINTKWMDKVPAIMEEFSALIDNQ